MKTAKRCLAALLAALLLATPLLAAGPYEASHASRAEDLAFLVENLEKVHPDMYANTTRQAVAEKRAYIEQNMDSWSDMDLSMEMRSLVGMLGDSHTNMGIKLSKEAGKVSVGTQLFDGKYIVVGTTKEDASFLGGELLSVNGISMDQVQQKLGTFLCADNDVWARRATNQMLYVWDLLAHFGILSADQTEAVLSVRDRTGAVRPMTVSPMTTEETNALVLSGEVAYLRDLRTGAAATEQVDNRYYKWLDLGGGNLYIQYNACMEDPELPMADFAAQVKAQPETDRYGRVIVDLRNNTGGSDGVIWELLFEILPYQQRGAQLYTLIGENTFSSGLINAVQLKQLGAVLVGEPTGGSVDHFGQVSAFELPNSGWKVGYSNKFIDMGGYYQAAAPYGVESLPPDILVGQTVADYLAGRDTAVEAILQQPVPNVAQTETATASQAQVLVDGEASALTGYRIGGEHYVAVRDVAAALQGTAAQFNVMWKPDGILCVSILPGEAYVPVGGELAALSGEAEAQTASALLLVSGGQPLQMLGQPGGLRAYRIGDRHYLRLRDLGAKLGFAVTWDEAGETVRLTTK